MNNIKRGLCMKKCKLYLQISMVVISVFVCVTFSVYTFYYLYNHDSDMAGIYAILIGIIIPLIISLCSYIITKIRKGILIERYLNDEHFVDRDIEYIKLSNLIKNESDRIIYIKGKFGMGKTSFMKMSCDRINYTDKNRWKSYAAFYYNNNYTKTITQALSNKFCGNPSASVTDISNKLNDSTLQKNSILFIDNIYEMNLIECTEFAKAFINCSRNNQVVIAVDSNDEVFHICPGQFSENEIELLAHSYNIEINPSERHAISELSNGYPVYARYSVEAYTKGLNIIDYNNLEHYIEKLLNSLSDLEKSALSLIICLCQILQDGVERKTIYGIDNAVTRPVIKRLITYSLINMYKEKIYIDKLISLKCIDFLGSYSNVSYNKIYHYYKGMTNTSYIALVAAFKSNFQYDHNLIGNILHKQYADNNFYLLIAIGELEFDGQINPHLRENRECWIYVRYYYLKALLELGLYDRAREVVDSYDYQIRGGINLLSINSDVEFEYQYLLVDLDHLTNYLKDAVTFSYTLLEKASTKAQIVKCRYLYAHCLRHLGEDLEQAYTVFEDLINDADNNDDKIRIRSIYSAASIRMFQCNINYPYKKAFDDIEHIICNNTANEIWKPYVARHKAIYEYKIRKNFKMAEKILLETIDLLEVTPLRIKYDIYFELGEVYRLMDTELDNYEKSQKYYLEAVQFAERVHDFNLYSNSQLGIMLLSIKHEKEIDNDILRTIISETYSLGLNINYNYALYVQHLIRNEDFSEELVTYWRKMHFSDLFSMSSKSESEKCNIKLTVM